MTLAYAGTSMTFVPTFHTIDKIDVLPRREALKDEVMFYQSTPSFVTEHGGPVAREFIRRLPNDMLGDDVLVDIRLHHLNPGHYPAIPGYHLDWIPRKDKGANPDMSVIPDYSHVVLIVAETSLTEFVGEPIDIPDIPDAKQFEYCNRYIIDKIGPRTANVISGDMVRFTSNDWHRPSPAEDREWRYLIRASRVSHVRFSNEIRTQAQVYIPTVEASW